MSTTTKPQTAPPSKTRPEATTALQRDHDVHHYVRNDDQSIALCGLDVSNHRWANATADCVVCAELYAIYGLDDPPRVNGAGR